jgi:hypothetical protein
MKMIVVRGTYFTSFSVAVEVEQGLRSATASNVSEERPWMDVAARCRRRDRPPCLSVVWYHKAVLHNTR